MSKHLASTLAIISIFGLAACSDNSNKSVDVTAAPWECIAAKVTIGTNAIDTVVRYNKVNGEAQLLNAASFASKATGAQGNVIGWVPLGDLRSAVQELVQREQAAQQQMPAATPQPTPEEKKKTEGNPRPPSDADWRGGKLRERTAGPAVPTGEINCRVSFSPSAKRPFFRQRPRRRRGFGR